MRYSTRIKPVSYLKAKAVIQDMASYEETLALLKILALGNQQVALGKVKPVAEVMKRLRGQSTGD